MNWLLRMHLPEMIGPEYRMRYLEGPCENRVMQLDPLAFVGTAE